jgi:4-amino-4-deoxy-L-arabinose transferase-like glycosyltransferase
VAVSQTSRRTRLILAALILLAAFAIVTIDSQRDSLWFDEAYTLYIVRDEGRPPDGLTDTARFVFNSLRSAIQRTREDVHPPLYFVLFDVWTMLVGESAYAARLPSALAGLIGLAATYALGKRLFDWRTGLIAAALLGTASIFIYYSREARMYTLLLALAALATLAYLRWREHPTWGRTDRAGLCACCCLLVSRCCCSLSGFRRRCGN